MPTSRQTILAALHAQIQVLLSCRCSPEPESGLRLGGMLIVVGRVMRPFSGRCRHT